MQSFQIMPNYIVRKRLKICFISFPCFALRITSSGPRSPGNLLLPKMAAVSFGRCSNLLLAPGRPSQTVSPEVFQLDLPSSDRNMTVYCDTSFICAMGPVSQATCVWQGYSSTQQGDVLFSVRPCTTTICCFAHMCSTPCRV